MFIVRRHDQVACNGEIARELACLKRMFNLALQAKKIIRKPYSPTLSEYNVRKVFFLSPWRLIPCWPNSQSIYVRG